MFKIFSRKKNLKATSLAEVLIIIAIISTTLIASVNLAASSVVTSKENEIDDTANALLVFGLELAKSPGDLIVNDQALVGSTVNQTYLYSMEKENSIYYLKRETADFPDCNASSPFKLDFHITTSSQNLNTNNYCLKLEITKRSNTRATYFELNVVVKYTKGSEQVTISAKGYRKDEFKQKI